MQVGYPAHQVKFQAGGPLLHGASPSLQHPYIGGRSASHSRSAEGTLLGHRIAAGGRMEGLLSDAEWPEPVQRVQCLADSGVTAVPARYIRPESDRPICAEASAPAAPKVPVIDLRGLENEGRERTMRDISEACKKWGFFQVVNHGVPPALMRRAKQMCTEFFRLPKEEKEAYASSPKTYQGYGSRLGIDRAAILDWGDYFFLHFLPLSVRDVNKWPAKPASYRETMDEYSRHVHKLCSRLLGVLSLNLGAKEELLEEAFGGGEDIGLTMRMNYYPKCPEPNLTLGLSSHCDPGVITVLLPDEQVPGLQVLKDGSWISVEPVAHALTINIGDQIQILTNGIYKSVEHRVTVNSWRERVSLAIFYNPKGDKVVSPAKDLVKNGESPLYDAMTFNQYRLFIRKKGPSGKSQVESLRKH